MKMLLLLVLILDLISPNLSQGLKVSCKDALVEDGKRSTLTFNFTEDISHSRWSVRVKHYIGTREENVLTCHWLTSMECDIRPTFEFEGTISNKLNIAIPKTTQSHEGRYACFVLSDDPSNYAICNLSIITKQQYVSSYPISPRPVIDDDEMPTPLPESPCSGSLTDNPLFPIVVVLAVFALIFGISTIVITIFCRKNRAAKNNNVQDNADRAAKNSNVQDNADRAAKNSNVQDNADRAAKNSNVQDNAEEFLIKSEEFLIKFPKAFKATVTSDQTISFLRKSYQASSITPTSVDEEDISVMAEPQSDTQISG